MTWLCAPVTARTCVTSVARLSAGALISTARSGTSPRRAATELFTTASTPGMPERGCPAEGELRLGRPGDRVGVGPRQAQGALRGRSR